MKPHHRGVSPAKQKTSPKACSALLAHPTVAAPASVTQEMLMAWLDFAPDALIVVDATDTIVQANAQMEALFGYAQGELIGHSVELLLPERLRGSYVAHRTHYLHAACSRPMGLRLDVVGRRKDGSDIAVDVNLRPILIERTLHVMGAIRTVTTQRKADSEHAQIVQRLHQQDKLIDLAHDAMLMCNLEGRILSWNEGAEHLYGWNAQEAVSKVVHELLQTCFPLSREAVNHSLQEHGQWQGELTRICHDGRQVVVESRQMLVHDEQGRPCAIVEVNRDVTELRRLQNLQEAQAENNARLQVLQLILDHISTGICLLQGPRLRLLMANQAATALWGAKWPPGQIRDEFARQQGVHFLTPSGQQLPVVDSPVGRAMNSGEPVLHSPVVIRQPDGTRLPTLLDAIPLEHLHLLARLPQEMTSVLAPAERVVLVVHYDVTVLKEAERLKDQFISLATHELRTPVTVIAGCADMLLRRAARENNHPLDEWQIAKLAEVKRATQQLAHLTEDLLDAMHLQSGQFRLELRPTDLVVLTRQVVERLQTTTTHHRFVLHLLPTQLWAMADALLIEQVLSNLLSNAMKYSPQGGSIEVTLEEEKHTHQARLSVRDHGMGIPREQHARIFGRFMRADNGRAAGIRGTGLGLYLCRELIERHGGQISFESEEGVGSTFFVSLPLS